MLIFEKIIKKKSFLSDRQTDTRLTQNYSSEPHKIVIERGKIVIERELHRAFVCQRSSVRTKGYLRGYFRATANSG